MRLVFLYYLQSCNYVLNFYYLTECIKVRLLSQNINIAYNCILRAIILYIHQIQLGSSLS